MSRQYELHNLAAIRGRGKHRDELPPALNIVVTASYKSFRHFIDTIADREEHTTFKRTTSTDVTIDSQRYIMCTSVRTVRGLRTYKLIELHDSDLVEDYLFIKDHYRAAGNY